ncbi:glycosyltransferase [Microaceticoccus formicicus]|uniref:glycosyltransferase n=1 Tax=Microaceticoccus formicicus TaxID=3118105 RepID=UPI003CD01F51|nr:glycosyltransferase [Peptoniphilaceae bacterium AMB_02]
MARMIFHVPNKIMPEMKSASHIRPFKMLEAFREIGYEVDFVMGDAKTRAGQIDEIKKKINDGLSYDFMYSESSTMPTLLTESHHLPTYPTLDFGFFKYLKAKGKKIGLFYRDMHWKFPLYRNSVKGLKYLLAIKMYEYDLRQYSKYLDVLYLPHMAMNEYLPEDLRKISRPLPPGFEKTTTTHKNLSEIKLIYVGGIGGIYELSELIKAVNEIKEIKLTICCRKGEWDRQKDKYPKLNDNIKVVHLSGDDLQVELDKSNLGVLTLKPNIYLSFAVPYKLFEYMGNNLPILVSNDTASADFVSENDIGFCVDYSYESISDKLEEIKSNPDLLMEKIRRIEEVKINHTWIARAKKVEEELKI